MKRVFFAALLSIVFSNSFAQDYSSYYQSINRGEWALEYKKDTAVFIKEYETAFAQVEPFLFDQIKLAKIYAQLLRWDKTAELAEKVMKKGYALNTFVSNLPFKTVFFSETDHYRQLKSMEKQYFLEFIGNIDFELYQRMYSMSETDQYLSKKAPTGDSVWRIAREKVVLHNFGELLNIVKKDGYPGERKLGYFATVTTGILLVHNVIFFDTTNQTKHTGIGNYTTLLYIKPDKNDTAVINELREQLKPLVMKGVIQPNTYALLYDNTPALIYDVQKMQYYGQFISRSTKTFVPIWDIKNVDKRRAEIGLPSLYEYAQMRNVELPKDYPIPEHVKK